MKIKLSLFTIIGFLTLNAFSQNSKEDSIKAAIKRETETFYNRDAAGWEAMFLHEPTTTRTIIAVERYSSTSNWDSFSVPTINYLKSNPKPVPFQLTTSNFLIKTVGNMAWAEYDQVLSFLPQDTSHNVSHESRVLVKEGGQWKMILVTTAYPQSFTSAEPHDIEATLNNTGYNLVRAKQYKDAIEVFKLNVKLFPKSSNTYDSLGESYALAGNKALAIQNYETSIKLNPQNETGKVALAKLKQK